MSKNKVKKPASSVKERLVTQDYSLPVNFLKRSELLLPYKSFVKRQDKEKFIKHQEIRVCERYKVHNIEVLKEVKKDDDTLANVKAVTDNDEDFFNIVNGRPLIHCIPLYKSLKTTWNNRLRTLQDIGFKRDIILNIDMNFRMEKETYDLSIRRLSEQAKIFDKFIMEDYQSSMRLLNEGEKLNVKLDAKIAELQSFADQSFTIMSRLLTLDYKYGLQQKYGRFLYYLSPPIWRSNHREFARSIEIEAKGFDFGKSGEEETFSDIFEKMRRKCLMSPVKPVLYFNRPQDLIDVFNGMEEQQLYHISRTKQIIPHTTSIKKGIWLLKQKIDQDSAVVTASIERFKNLLAFYEERSFQLETQFFKILNGLFYKSIGTINVLKFILHLEFCYEKVFHEKPLNLDMVTMAEAIEKSYMDYSKKLDSIQNLTVRSAMKKCMHLSNMKIVRAKKATKELRLFNRLEDELLRAHNLNFQETNMPSKNLFKQASNDNLSKSRKCKISIQSLNDVHLEYLTLFTDWTKTDDPALYLQSLQEKSIAE